MPKHIGDLLFLVSISIILDVVTGISKAKITHTTNSNRGFKGFWRKMSYILSIFFGVFLDLIFHYLDNMEILKISDKLSFGSIIGIYIILNECISVCENLRDCGVKLPRFISSMLKDAEKSIDQGKEMKTKK